MKAYVAVGVAALACSTGAFAQSSVTVFGFIEAQVGRQTQQPAGLKLFDMAGSRLGFKGEEDMGGGLKASFYLEHRLNPDDGTANGPFWKGGSWVGLSSEGLGSVKLGRWWSQAFLKSQYAADPFGMGTLGEGTYPTVGCGPAFSGGCLGAFWVNNSVTYENSFGGFSFGAQYGLEVYPKHPVNFGVSYSDGPLYLGAGYEAHNDGSSSEKWTSLAANYDFGVAKAYVGYGTGRDAADVSRKNTIIGATVPMGQSQFIVSYDMQTQGGVRVENLLSLGYKYFLSKRTNIFAVVAHDGKAADADAFFGRPGPTNKSGYALGVFHSF